MLSLLYLGLRHVFAFLILLSRSVDRKELRPFDVRVDRRGKTAILRLSGEFDIAVTDQVDACIKELAGNSPDEVVIDLSGVSFIDSTGLRSLIRARALAPETGWSVKLVRGRPSGSRRSSS